MKRHIQGLKDADQSGADLVREGMYLVRVNGAHYCWDSRKPFYFLRFSLLEPNDLTGRSITSRLYCSRRVLRKLTWFLRDFGYDAELLGQDEIDEKVLVGLTGVVNVRHTVV